MVITKHNLGLLDLPLALRFYIYKFALVQAIDVQTPLHLEDAHHVKASRKSAGYHPGFERVPYLALTLTCRSIYNEVLSIGLETLSSPLHDEFHTFKADLDVYVTGSKWNRDGTYKERTTVKWSQLPCPPAQARRLVLNLCADTEAALTWKSYTTYAIQDALSRVLENGPRLHSENKLSALMKMDLVVVNLDRRGSDLLSPERRFMLPRDLYHYIEESSVNHLLIKHWDGTEVEVDNGGKDGGFKAREGNRVLMSTQRRSRR